MDETKETGEGSESSAEGRFARAKDFVGEKYSTASDAVKDKYSAASDAVKDQYARVRERVDEVDFNAVTEQVRSYVRSNPGKALLISVGAGFLIGLLLRRGDEDDD